MTIGEATATGSQIGALRGAGFAMTRPDILGSTGASGAGGSLSGIAAAFGKERWQQYEAEQANFNRTEQRGRSLGSLVGGVVGGLAGSYVGIGYQAGSAIGGAIGGEGGAYTVRNQY